MGRYFPRDEYELRWQRVHDEMRRREIGTAVVWGKTSATFDRAGDILYLTNYFSGGVGHGFDTSTHRARAFSAVLLQTGETPELHADDPELRRDVSSRRIGWPFTPTPSPVSRRPCARAGSRDAWRCRGPISFR